MDPDGRHHVARIDEALTADGLHKCAEAIAVPDFNYVEQALEAVAFGLSDRRRQRGVRRPNETGTGSTR